MNHKNRLVVLLTLLSTAALAQGVAIKDGSTTNLATVDASGRLITRVADSAGNQPSFAEDGRLDIGRDTGIFQDRFIGSAVAAHNKWQQSLSTMTVAVATGAITLNSGASAAVSVYATLTSVQKFRGYTRGDLYFTARARPNNLPQTNALAELGFGNALTNATPTDGAFFRWTFSGAKRHGYEPNMAEAARTVQAAFQQHKERLRQLPPG